MTSREKFEAAHVLTDLNFAWATEGVYMSDQTQQCWFSWKAALGSLDVEAGANAIRVITLGYDDTWRLAMSSAILSAARGDDE